MRWRLMLCGFVTSGLALTAQAVPVRAEAIQEAAPPAAVSMTGTGKAATPASTGGGETIQQALCRLIDASARAQELPVEFLTRLIWQESSFRTGVVSSAGAQGVAQFMPGTAAERGLVDPFDPEQAIPASARLLRTHVNQFGNVGLAAAAYNGGPGRISNWLADKGGLPEETRSYVIRITGRSAEDWVEERRARERVDAGAEAGEGTSDDTAKAESPKSSTGKQASTSSIRGATSCLQTMAVLRQPSRVHLTALPAAAAATSTAKATVLSPAPWGVQLAGNFSKDLALASYARARQSYAGALGAVRPVVVGTRLRSRGTRTFYQVRVPATTRAAADELCSRIRNAGGACMVVPS